MKHYPRPHQPITVRAMPPVPKPARQGRFTDISRRIRAIMMADPGLALDDDAARQLVRFVQRTGT